VLTSVIQAETTMKIKDAPIGQKQQNTAK
jgi:hypothetical protein